MTEILIGPLKNVQTSVEGRSSIARASIQTGTSFEFVMQAAITIASAMIQHHQACVRAIAYHLRKHRSIGQIRLPHPARTVAALTIEPVGYADRGLFRILLPRGGQRLDNLA